MDGSVAGQRTGWPQEAGAPAFDLVAAKLLRPLARPGTVGRSALIDRLARDDARPIISVVAPAGYGKTTLLSQWAESNGRAFAWVSVDEADNDPKLLLTYVAEALNAVEPIAGRCSRRWPPRRAWYPARWCPGSSMTSPVALVLEIAAELFLSPHTIKSQMKSIYRKLDSTSRTQTVTRARGLGLLEG